MDALTNNQATALQSICLGVQNAQVGERLKDAVERIAVNESAVSEVQSNELVQLTKEITTGTTTIQTVVVPFDIEILDVVVQARGASTNGTMKLQDGTTDITNAIICAVDKVITRAGTIDDAKSTIVAGATLGVICAGDAVGSTIGLVTIIGKRA